MAGSRADMIDLAFCSASRGLGLEYVRQIAEAGNVVFATCRNPGTATKLQALAESKKDKIHVVALDVQSEASIKEAAAAVGKLLGDEPLDYLMNNAAMVRSCGCRSCGLVQLS